LKVEYVYPFSSNTAEVDTERTVRHINLEPMLGDKRIEAILQFPTQVCSFAHA